MALLGYFDFKFFFAAPPLASDINPFALCKWLVPYRHSVAAVGALNLLHCFFNLFNLSHSLTRADCPVRSLSLAPSAYPAEHRFS